jgi:diguanylate cyclase (GGDEF)-like protein
MLPWAVFALAVAASLALWQMARARVRLRDAVAMRLAAQADALEARAAQESLNRDLELLGRFGNLLIGCTDLAEALQTSEQMLSQLLPDSAGSIYPLLDGEGLAEATHLWGQHAADTRQQASSEECHCMLDRRVHLGRGDLAETVCAHVAAGSQDFSSACIPLTTQGDSLGWLYLSSRGIGPLPKLKVAVAAADQLAFALANLKLRQSLRDLSVRDPLTGLFNRRYLSESLGRELARCERRQLPLSVLAFDLDHFKVFNDDYGHAAGDAILRGFARVLEANSRSEDIACRQGGEEFLVILPEMDREVALRRAAALMRQLAAMEVQHQGRLLPKLTTSIGLAMFPEHGADPAALLAQADTALYAAKTRGAQPGGSCRGLIPLRRGRREMPARRPGVRCPALPAAGGPRRARRRNSRASPAVPPADARRPKAAPRPASSCG